MKKEGSKHCAVCKKKISLNKNHFILVGTYNRETKPDDEVFFHFQCWVEYFNKRVNERARQNVMGIQEKALKILENPEIKSILSQIQGSDQLVGMLQTPLQKEHFELYHKQKIQKLKKIMNNDRKKRRKTNRKKKVQEM
jgi:hypothetical protein